MKNIWVILNETKDEIVEIFETVETDSKPHWDKFYKHRPGCVFCGRTEERIGRNFAKTMQLNWYYNYFYWEDTMRWGYGDPVGIAWSSAMTLPDPIKMLVMLGEK